MNARQFFVTGVLGLSVLCGATSCNKENTADESLLGKYTVTEAGSPYQSIELTADGDYIITRNVAATKAGETDDPDDVWVYGKFIVQNGHYILEGFADLVIESLGNGLFTLSVTSSNGEYDSVVVDARIESKVESTNLNQLLCRHWLFQKSEFSLSYDKNGQTIVSIPSIGCDFSGWNRETGEEGNENLDDVCTGLIFTESGTYAIVYGNGKVSVGSWQWESKEDGTLVCDWETGYQSAFKDLRFAGSISVSVQEGAAGGKDICLVEKQFETTIAKLFKNIALTVTYTYTLVEE